jgi:hypothetical protein
MKINSRFIFGAVIIALIAALGFNHGAWAGPLMAGTVPDCAESLTGSNPLTTCDAITTSQGGTVTVTDIALPGDQYPLVPGSLNFGPAVDLQTGGNLTEVCFPDIDTPPVGNIWRWISADGWLAEYNSIQAGSWVYWPTYHKGNLTCTMTSASGIYTIEY